MSIRLLVVEDHPIFAAGLVALLASTPDLQVIATVADAPEAIHATAGGSVDVVLMDLNLPSLSGVEATARILSRPNPPAVLVVTMVDDDDTVLAALRAGARGYILKGASGDQIISAVRAVADGAAVFGAGVAAQVLTLAANAQRPFPGGNGELTDRERQVLELLADGASNAQIARNLGLTLKTVQNYISRILDKLQVTDRTQAALKARQRRQPHP